MTTIDAQRYPTRKVRFGSGLEMAYIREGQGHPVVLLHGYPMTKRLWWRNVGEIAAAGFDVIAPDLRGYGDSGTAADGRYDIAAYAQDIRELLTALVGVRQCTVVGADIGGAVALDLALRPPSPVAAICLYNAAAPDLAPDRLAGLDLPGLPPLRELPQLDYFFRQGEDAEGLRKELDTPQRCREYIAGFYTYRRWAAPGAFSAKDVAFMCEPFGDPDRLRTTWYDYEIQCGLRASPEDPVSAAPVPQPALVLFGPDDPVGDPRFVRLCREGFERCVGPFAVPDAGHFLPWEQPDTFNGALVSFLRAQQ